METLFSFIFVNPVPLKRPKASLTLRHLLLDTDLETWLGTANKDGQQLRLKLSESRLKPVVSQPCTGSGSPCEDFVIFTLSACLGFEITLPIFKHLD